MGVILQPEINNNFQPVFGSGYRLNHFHPLNKDLVFWALLNERSGGSAKSLLGHPGVLVNEASWSTGPWGSCVSFTADARVSYGDILDFTTVPISIIADIYPITEGEDSLGRIVNKQPSGSATGYLFFVASTGRLAFIAAGSTVRYSDNNAYSLGVWQRVGMSYDGTNIYFYNNGRAVGITAYTNVPTANAEPLSIGNRYVGDRCFDGKIANVQIWKRFLSIQDHAYYAKYPFGSIDNPRLIFPSLICIEGSGIPPTAFYASLSENIPAVQDTPYSTLQRHLMASISDTIPAPSDSLEPSSDIDIDLQGSLSESISAVGDSAAAMLNESFAGSVSETIPAVSDSVVAALLHTDQALRWIVLVEITPNTSLIDPLYLSSHPVRHPSRYYEPRIKSHGLFTRAISAPVGFIKTGDCRLVLSDSDNSLRQRISPKSIHGAEAVIYLGIEGESHTAFLRPFRRVVADVDQSQDGEIGITLRDMIWLSLNQQIPSLMNTDNFPNLPEASSSEFASIIYGHVSSRTNMEGAYLRTAVPRGGALKCHLVDESTYTYIVARHPCKSVEVWKRPIGQEEFERVTSGYSRVTQVLASGHEAEMLVFTQDQEGAEIQVNVDGIFEVNPENKFVGFRGRAGWFIDSISMLYVSNLTGETLQTEEVGGSGGVYYSDTDIPDGAIISAIRVWAGDVIYALQLVYTLEGGGQLEGTKHGDAAGLGGTYYVYEFGEGEFILSISGKYGDYINRLAIHTNKRSPATPRYGGTGGTTEYEIIINELTGVNFADTILNLLIEHLGIENSLERINYSSFAQTQTRVLGLICAGAFTEPITWGEALTQLQRSSNIDLFLDKDDRITAHYTSDDDEPVIDIDDLMRLYRGTVKQTTADPTYNRLPYSYASNYNTDKWHNGEWNNTGDQTVLGQVMIDEPLKMYFIRDLETALTVIEHRGGYLDLDAFTFEGEIPLIPVLNELELAQLVSIEHFGGIKIGGYTEEQFKILELSMDLDNMKYQFKGIRRKIPPPHIVEAELDARTKINARNGPFSNEVDGELFGCFLDPLDNKNIIILQTTDYGETWNESDAENAPVMIDNIASFDCVVLNGELHIATQENPTGRVEYHKYSMTDREWKITNEEIVEYILNTISYCVSIEPRYPDEQIFIYFQGEREQVNGSWYQRGWYVYGSSSLWSEEVMITPDPGQYTENLVGKWAAHANSSNCWVERVISGRNNRMHFFYSVNPAVTWVQWSPDLYSVSITAGGQASNQQLHYGTGVSYPSQRNLGGFVHHDDRATVAGCRRIGYGNTYIQKYSEGYPLIATGGISLGGYVQISHVNENPAAFVAYDEDLEKLHVVDASKGPGYIRLADITGYSHNEDDDLKAGPEELSIISDNELVGNIFTVRGRRYIAYFTGENFPTYRWLRVDKLPYTEDE